jgi:Holliday junction resolvase
VYILLGLPNKNYIKGRNFEYRVKKLYEKLGWDVHRKYASKGIMDLICIRKGHVHYVQCKVRKNLMRAAEAELLKEHANKFGCDAVFAYKDEKRHVVTELLN